MFSGLFYILSISKLIFLLRKLPIMPVFSTVATTTVVAFPVSIPDFNSEEKPDTPDKNTGSWKFTESGNTLKTI